MKINTVKELRDKIKTELDKDCSVALLTHFNPDGDGLPACLGFQEYFRNKGKNIDIILETKAPEKFLFLDVYNRTKVVDKTMEYDVIIIIDTHEIYRTGECGFLVENAKVIFCIDHHLENEIIDRSYNFIDHNYASAGIVVHELYFEEMKSFEKESLDFFMKAIYTTILNDTGNFMNANTGSKSFNIASVYTDNGFIPGNVAEKFLYNKDYKEMKFVGEVLTTIKVYDESKHLFFYSTLEMQKKYNINKEQTSKMAFWARGIKDVKAICYLNQLADNKFKISLRSNYYDVNKIAVKFDGGGHKNASGCTILACREKIEEMILLEFRNQMNE